ncbi:unnamed protein product, partial [Discosporangium mesarthrocarpum]
EADSVVGHARLLSRLDSSPRVLANQLRLAVWGVTLWLASSLSSMAGVTVDASVVQQLPCPDEEHNSSGRGVGGMGGSGYDSPPPGHWSPDNGSSVAFDFSADPSLSIKHIMALAGRGGIEVEEGKGGSWG